MAPFYYKSRFQQKKQFRQRYRDFGLLPLVSRKSPPLWPIIDGYRKLFCSLAQCHLFQHNKFTFPSPLFSTWISLVKCVFREKIWYFCFFPLKNMSEGLWKGWSGNTEQWNECFWTVLQVIQKYFQSSLRMATHGKQAWSGPNDALTFMAWLDLATHPEWWAVGSG